MHERVLLSLTVLVVTYNTFNVMIKGGEVQVLSSIFLSEITALAFAAKKLVCLSF